MLKKVTLFDILEASFLVPNRLPRKITLRDLRCCSRDIAAQLALGHAFVLFDEGRPLAHLTPLRPSSTFTFSDDLVWRTQLAELRTLLGERDVARILGISEHWVTGERPLPPVVMERLTFLTVLTAQLNTWIPSARLSAWFRRSRRELQQRSPMEVLAFPWDAHDGRSALVLRMARDDLQLHVTRRSSVTG